jgi:hypothetical protein
VELKFILGMVIVMIGFVLMLPEKNVVQNVVQDKKVYDSPLKNQRVPDTARGYARSMVSAKEYEALEELIMLESSWNSEAQNPKSTAYGLGQFIDQTWDLVGIEKSADYRIQLIATHKYVMNRYGSWVKALEFRKTNGYY